MKMRNMMNKRKAMSDCDEINISFVGVNDYLYIKLEVIIGSLVWILVAGLKDGIQVKWGLLW